MALATGLLATTAACGEAATLIATSVQAPTPAVTISPTAAVTEEPVTEDPGQTRFVRVDQVVFPVELALTSEQRIQGLSGREFLDSGTGMLFVFDEESERRFWMREMEFSLDIIWIDAECRVVDISGDAPFPEPDTPVDDLPSYSPDAPAQYVLEINGGEFEALGLRPGDAVKFLGGLSGQFGC